MTVPVTCDHVARSQLADRLHCHSTNISDIVVFGHEPEPAESVVITHMVSHYVYSGLSLVTSCLMYNHRVLFGVVTYFCRLYFPYLLLSQK